MNWSTFLDAFGRSVLVELGESPDWLPGDYNPITRALKDDPTFVERVSQLDGFSRLAMSRVATICQMAVFDQKGGPEGDGKPKALRRHWYSWYKGDFSQPLALALGDFEINTQGVKEISDRLWTGRLSTTYAEFVDSGEVTYKDLWVEDASRMMAEYWEKLFRGCHIIVAVEKDSLFADFEAAAKALGATSVYSGKGKSSKAAIEKVLRDHFHWRIDHQPFAHDNPLIILHISDYDYDGEAVIGPTFGEQASRYAGHILEARVGVEPVNVTDAGYAWDDRWYQVKVSNKGYQTWSEDKALFMASCMVCEYTWPVKGSTARIEKDGEYLVELDDYGRYLREHECPECGGPAVDILVGKHTAHGFEVEALTTRTYYGLLVDALLQVLPFDYIVNKLRDECQADAVSAASTIADSIFDENDDYQRLLKEFDRLEEIKDAFERRVKDRLAELGEPHIEDWRDDDNDPTPEDFREHVKTANGYTGPWRPFNTSDRTRSLIAWLEDNEAETIEGFKNEPIEW